MTWRKTNRKPSLRTLDRRMRKLRRDHKRAASWGYVWLAEQISREIEALAKTISEREKEI